MVAAVAALLLGWWLAEVASLGLRCWRPLSSQALRQQGQDWGCCLRLLLRRRLQ